jgi:Na+/H+ antiporter NhaD/arsenite permease-like protein
MHWIRTLIPFVAALLTPAIARAGQDAGHAVNDLPVWTVLPFAALLLCIALLPLFTGRWWHQNRNKALVTLLLALPVFLYLAYLHWSADVPALALLAEKALEYISFLAMLGSLYVVAGGIVIAGELPCRASTNVGFLATGAVLANLIGTTGASVLLIRPFLRINKHRQRKWHLPVFFIMIVSNTGGLLTPLGDPPLFLGFLDGIPFGWTLGLWRHWLFVNALILIVFFVWDRAAFKTETAQGTAPESELPGHRFRIHGFVNVGLLAGIIGSVLLQGSLMGPFKTVLPPILMLGIGLLSLRLTPTGLRSRNAFTWEPIVEVAILFAGIFVTMIPALEILGASGGNLGVSRPWHYFWLTGLLSSCLDNAPTYLTFGSLASGPHDMGWLAANEPLILQAISCGAVFMGALTYIGNGPNFMIKAIAREAGYETPSFFGYICFACAILLPIFLLVTIVFFRA